MQIVYQRPPHEMSSLQSDQVLQSQPGECSIQRSTRVRDLSVWAGASPSRPVAVREASPVLRQGAQERSATNVNPSSTAGRENTADALLGYDQQRILGESLTSCVQVAR
jgi:hypothetical protein